MANINGSKLPCTFNFSHRSGSAPSNEGDEHMMCRCGYSMTDDRHLDSRIAQTEAQIERLRAQKLDPYNAVMNLANLRRLKALITTKAA